MARRTDGGGRHPLRRAVFAWICLAICPLGCSEDDSGELRTAIPRACLSDATCMAKMPNVPACMRAMCNPKVGCELVATANGAPCESGACAPTGSCQAGSCVAAQAGSPCDDGNPCTVDSCQQADATCSHLPDDSATCTTDRCGDGQCNAGVCSAKDPTALWDTYYKVWDYDAVAWAWALAPRLDGGWFIGGGVRLEEPEEGYNYRFFVIATDAGGVKLWQRETDWAALTTANQPQTVYAMATQPDGSVLAVGRLQDQAFAWRLSADGATLGSDYTGEAGADQVAEALEPLAAGGALVAGTHTPIGSIPQGFLAYLSTKPQFAAGPTLPAHQGSQLHALTPGNGGFIAVGTVSSAGQELPWLLNLSAQGQPTGEVVLTQLPGYMARAVAVRPDGGLWVAGESPAQDGQAWLAGITAAGVVQWQKEWGKAGVDALTGLVVVADAAVAVGETANLGGGNRDGLLVAVGADGTERWVKTYGGGDVDTLHALARVSTGKSPPGLALVGATVTELHAAPVPAGLGAAPWLIRTAVDGAERCDGKALCTAQQVVNCDDGDAATLDRCDPLTGNCLHSKP